MIGWLIIACEIGFWVFVLAGLLARYIFKKKKIGTLLLICTPIVDIILLIATVNNLKNGAVATTVHGISAIYIGVSVVFGHRMIKWADENFAYRFANGEKPIKKKKYGREHAKQERSGWYRHFVSWLIGGSILAVIILFINNPSQTKALLDTLELWSFILVIDFIVSFSYTLFPRKG
ncbi:2TM domain-containing protein [Neobacillus drentensis]|uniref:2TM domain-containing protein n=1 Tax=Neobacillus drentensis TaxID=220684 RepID=UPI003000A86F